MKGKIAKLFITLSALVCTIMAFTISASACNWGMYQPEEPECLRK
ncbi:cyclic lactone autoinducer peptide [Clostridium sp. HV4-5-A1G]|nr:cyclic lactone autoinducer peptide [Clostridium sp. HV4-5-A1G]KAA8679335.1 cyclic lactone autoinducer peptide [Clostridium sp. HV4-5-A1G]